MKIGIDARLYSQTGVGRYIRNLIFELQQIDKVNSYIIYLGKNEYHQFKPVNKLWRKKLLDIPWHTLREQLIVPQVFLADNLDVIHFPYFNIPILYPKNYLLTIHDLIVDHFDTGRASTQFLLLYKIKRLGYKLAHTLGIKRAKLISVISESTKKEVIEHYHVPSFKLITTYDALDSNFQIQLSKIKKVDNYYHFDYLLYVGNAYPHKNLFRLIDAFKRVRQHKKIKLVLAGDDHYFYPRLQNYVEKEGLSSQVIFFGNANDQQLTRLYSHARCLIFPSLMEGFGLPNLEAASCGCLPIVSDIPVFREIWGDLLPAFNPQNTEDIKNKILEVLDYPSEKYRQIVSLAKSRVKDFSWKKSASLTLSLYKRIVENR